MIDRIPRGRVLFQPTPEDVERSKLTAYCRALEASRGLSFRSYSELHAWSVRAPADFWRSIWEYFGLPSPDVPTEVLTSTEMPGARWFPGVRVNYAAQALRAERGALALVAIDEAGRRSTLYWGELRDRVAACRAGLRRLGVGKGDRAVAYLPNSIEAVVAFLACASLGVVWSSCPPEFGAESVLDRFSQIEPKVMLAVDGYRYGGRWFERRAEVEAIRRGLALEAVVLVRRGEGPAPAHDYEWDEWLRDAGSEAALDFEWVEFEHPLWILYSSGTTGKPKPIVHGHGGILLEHCKVLSLHSDLGPEDRFFWYSTTGWMMWNYLIGGLLVGATVVLYDGSPASPDLSRLWRLAEAERLTYFGTSAPFLMACRDRRLEPKRIADLSALRGLGSTGAPLPPEGFEWVYQAVSERVALGSVSGGTDLCTAFVVSCPWLPVRAGELQCSALGADVRALDETGQAVLGRVGELVIGQPMPSMPVFFWNDPGGRRHRESYFEQYPGTWRHGDWICQFEDGAAVIQGRSDATLNRGGVRMGTSEFYRVVEALPEVADSLVVEVNEGGRDGQLWLFVVLHPEVSWSSELARQIKSALRQQLSPRHVPDVSCVVDQIPYTLSGKKLELPVKRLLEGRPLAEVAAPGTLRDPRALEALLERAKAASGAPAQRSG